MRINDPHPYLPSGYYFYNIKCSLNPFVFSNKTVSHQFSCKIQVLDCSVLGAEVIASHSNSIVVARVYTVNMKSAKGWL